MGVRALREVAVAPARRLDDPTRRPDGFACESPALGMRWLRADGELEYVRCGASNRCDYCAMLAAVENAVVLRLDAFSGGFARVGLTTTTRRPNFGWEALRKAEASLWRTLRREHGRQVEYCGMVEWTTGTSTWARANAGARLPHVHHLVKGIATDGWTERDEARFEAGVSAHWHRYTRDAWRVEARRLRTPMGAVAYLVLHHHKREQGPPPGTKRVRRLRSSKGFMSRPIGELREQARELLRDERLYAELVEVLDVPDRAPSYLVEELIAERIDEARARARWNAPKLCHVRERRVFDNATGEVAYRFEGVLRVLAGRDLREAGREV